MRKLMMLALLVLGAFVAGLSPRPADATTCVTYCAPPDACGHVCCYRQCCGKICVDLDCAPPCVGN
jgi:hypothetical protein